LLLRMPPALHGEVARAAEEAGVSLNGYINQCLGEKVGWLHGENGHQVTHTPPPDSTLTRLLVVNVVAIAAAAAAAVAILLVVWLG
jgi:hypothetical protein